VELVFDGPPPALGLLDTEVDGNTVRIYGDEPAAIAAQVLGGLEVARGGLRGVEFVTPSLESVFLTLTGRRFGADGDAPGTGPAVAEEAAEVGAR
jgi:ABC-2 type transport system ATP-binding protein